MFKRIIVAVSPNASDEHIVNEAVSMAQLSNATLMLLHVLSPLEEGYPTPIYPGPDSVYPGLHQEAIRAYAEQWDIYQRNSLEYLKKLANGILTAGVSVEFTQNAGDPGRVVCELAKNWNADLIIIGRRGYTGIKELFLGSVSNYVLHHAPCSVLTIQGEGLKGEDG
ncbi:MAG: universal stress protein [Oscillatoriales cyanobacterium C42_A2020_001]|nr:universal stress protein [Leptolyngbyaceae cyanobacterium C42_A2020_001]